LEIENFKMEERVRKRSERLLDYGVEIEGTRQLSNIIAKLTITAKESK